MTIQDKSENNQSFKINVLKKIGTWQIEIFEQLIKLSLITIQNYF